MGMTSFVLRAIGLATVLYFVFVFPMGKQTFAQAVAEVWEQTQLRHAIEVKSTQMRREMGLKMRRWQQQQLSATGRDDGPQLAADANKFEEPSAAEADAALPPIARPKQPGTRPHPKHARGRPGSTQTPSDGDGPL